MRIPKLGVRPNKSRSRLANSSGWGGEGKRRGKMLVSLEKKRERETREERIRTVQFLPLNRKGREKLENVVLGEETKTLNGSGIVSSRGDLSIARKVRKS